MNIKYKLRPDGNFPILRNQDTEGGLFSVQSYNQMLTTIGTKYRQLDANRSTLVHVYEDNTIYKLINNPATEITQSSDWQVALNFNASQTPLGTWNYLNDDPVLQDADAVGNANKYYFVVGTSSSQPVQYAGLFGGTIQTVKNGYWLYSTGSKWLVIPLTFQAIIPEELIIDYFTDANGDILQSKLPPNLAYTDDIQGTFQSYAQTAGTGSAYTAGFVPAISSLQYGESLKIKLHTATLDDPTLNVGDGNVLPLVTNIDNTTYTNVKANQFTQGKIIQIAKNVVNGTDVYEVLSGGGGGADPDGNLLLEGASTDGRLILANPSAPIDSRYGTYVNDSGDLKIVIENDAGNSFNDILTYDKSQSTFFTSNSKFRIFETYNAGDIFAVGYDGNNFIAVSGDIDSSRLDIRGSNIVSSFTQNNQSFYAGFNVKTTHGSAHLIAQSDTDVSVNPIFIIDTSLTTGDVTARPLLDFRNNGTVYTQVNSNGDWTFSNTVTIQGTLVVQGASFEVDSQITTTDASIILNSGEAGAGITLGYSGFEIDRGSSDNYFFGFDETRDLFVLGTSATDIATDLASFQAVATRIDNPTDGHVAIWDDANKRLNFITPSTGNVSSGTLTSGRLIGSTGTSNIESTIFSYDAFTIKFDTGFDYFHVGRVTNLFDINTVDVGASGGLYHVAAEQNQCLAIGASTYPAQDATSEPLIKFIIQRDASGNLSAINGRKAIGIYNYNERILDISHTGTLSITYNSSIARRSIDKQYILLHDDFYVSGNSSRYEVEVSTSLDAGTVAATEFMSRSVGGALTTRPAFAWYNYNTKLGEINYNGDWDYNDNKIINISYLSFNNPTSTVIAVQGAQILDNSRNLTNITNLTLSGIIKTGTSDGSDNSAIQITGGGGLGTSRGAYLEVIGNENVGNAGFINLQSGSASAAGVIIKYNGAAGSIGIYDNDSNTVLFHNASGTSLSSKSGQAITFNARGGGSLIFQIGGTTRWNINSSGHFVPQTDNTVDIGTASIGVRNIYTNDLHLSNEYGDYTIVEGEEDLFLYNNKTNKVFKFALIEVDPTNAPPKNKQ